MWHHIVTLSLFPSPPRMLKLDPVMPQYFHQFPKGIGCLLHRTIKWLVPHLKSVSLFLMVSRLWTLHNVGLILSPPVYEAWKTLLLSTEPLPKGFWSNNLSPLSCAFPCHTVVGNTLYLFSLRYVFFFVTLFRHTTSSSYCPRPRPTHRPMKYFLELLKFPILTHLLTVTLFRHTASSSYFSCPSFRHTASSSILTFVL